MLNQISEQDKKKKAELEKLKEQFEEEQKYKQANLSKQAKDKKQKDESNLTVAQQKRNEDNQYQLDQAKVLQEEEFFNKWLKQRENLGV